MVIEMDQVDSTPNINGDKLSVYQVEQVNHGYWNEYDASKGSCNPKIVLNFFYRLLSKWQICIKSIGYK